MSADVCLFFEVSRLRMIVLVLISDVIMPPLLARHEQGSSGAQIDEERHGATSVVKQLSVYKWSCMLSRKLSSAARH